MCVGKAPESSMADVPSLSVFAADSLSAGAVSVANDHISVGGGGGYG